jgi:hypothetical protein
MPPGRVSTFRPHYSLRRLRLIRLYPYGKRQVHASGAITMVGDQRRPQCAQVSFGAVKAAPTTMVKDRGWSLTITTRGVLW